MITLGSRMRTASRSTGVCVEQVIQDGRWVDHAIRIGSQSIPILGVANCTGRPLPEARAGAKRVLAFVAGRPPRPDLRRPAVLTRPDRVYARSCPDLKMRPCWYLKREIRILPQSAGGCRASGGEQAERGPRSEARGPKTEAGR